MMSKSFTGTSWMKCLLPPHLTQAAAKTSSPSEIIAGGKSVPHGAQCGCVNVCVKSRCIYPDCSLGISVPLSRLVWMGRNLSSLDTLFLNCVMRIKMHRLNKLRLAQLISYLEFYGWQTFSFLLKNLFKDQPYLNHQKRKTLGGC